MQNYFSNADPYILTSGFDSHDKLVAIFKVDAGGWVAVEFLAEKLNAMDISLLLVGLNKFLGEGPGIIGFLKCQKLYIGFFAFQRIGQLIVVVEVPIS